MRAPAINNIKTFDPFISIIIYFTFYYFLDPWIFITVSDNYFTLLYSSYRIWGFLFPASIAILYLILRKYSLPVKSYLIRSWNELLYIFLGFFLLCLISYIEDKIGFWFVGPAFLRFFNSNEQYYFFNVFYIVFLSPLFHQTLFMGFFFEILRKIWPLTAAVMTILFASVIAHFAGLAGIIGVFFLILNQLVFILVYINGSLGAAIVVNSIFNVYLYLSTIYKK